MKNYFRSILIIGSLITCAHANAYGLNSRTVNSTRVIYSGSSAPCSNPTALNPCTTSVGPQGVTILPSAPNSTTSISVFDSSGQTMMIQVTSGQIISYMIMPPGGGGFPLNLNKGDSVAIVSLSSTAVSGESDINFFY